MEAVNGVSEVDKGGPPAPSPLTGCYLLVVVGEPHSKEHKDIILRRIAKGLLSWDISDCHVDLEKELAIITDQAPDGEDARYGERLIQFASENLVTEILIHPAISTLSQCMKNLLSSFTRHRHIIHAGYTFAANGSWILQDGTFSLTDFSESFQEMEVQRVLRAYDNSISLDIHCSPEGDWTRLPKDSFTKNCKVRVNPDDVLTSGSPSIVNFLNYISPFLVPTDIETLLESSDVVGNIRFSHPTLYVFPGGQGDAALFGINGFNMLVDGGFARKACFWDFVRHLDRLDAVLLTRLNNSNVSGISSVLRRKRCNTVYPQIGHFFCNIQERKAILSPDGDKDKDPLIVNLLEEGQEIVSNLRQLHLQPQSCYREIEPINLYHKVGHGTLDMYVLSPAKESKEVREFIQKWNTNDQRLFANQRNGRDFTFPTQNLVSICALLVWQPANANDSITRILFPGSTPQHKIFEGLDRLKQLECIKYPSCSAKTLTPSLMKSKQAKVDKIIQQEQKENKTKERLVQQSESKAKVENKVAEENIKNIQTNGVTPQVITEKIIKKHDSTESEKSGPQSLDGKKPDEGREPTGLTNGKHTEEKVEKAKPKTKPEQKPKIEAKVFKHTRSIERKPKPPADKKASPTTPKKTLDAKVNGDGPTKPRTLTKVSPSATPAKSAKEANNRKVVESKYKVAPKKEISKPDKKEAKPERKPISRRPKESSPSGKVLESPVKKLNELHKVEARKTKLEKEGTTDSSTVSTPSADAETALKKDISKLTPEELEQLKARELAELKEEQEVVKEIEAVFRKSEHKKTDDSDLRKVKNISVDDKTDGEGEEYLIIEKEEIEHDSLDEKETKESETQKHLRDSEESEKQRKLSGEVTEEVKDIKEVKPVEAAIIVDEPAKVQDSEAIPTIDVVQPIDEKEQPKEVSKEVSVGSPDDKVDVSSGKKVTDRDIDEENKDANVLESQPDEKFSTPIESGATTAPTLPEDERIPLDEIKEDNADQVIEEKYVKEDTKEKEIPVVQLPPKTTETVAKLPTVVGIRLDKQTPIRDLVKTPDEVADLPVHEEVDIENYEQYNATQSQTPKQEELKQISSAKQTKLEKAEKEPVAKTSTAVEEKESDKKIEDTPKLADAQEEEQKKHLQEKVDTSAEVIEEHVKVAEVEVLHAAKSDLSDKVSEKDHQEEKVDLEKDEIKQIAETLKEEKAEAEKAVGSTTHEKVEEEKIEMPDMAIKPETQNIKDEKIPEKKETEEVDVQKSPEKDSIKKVEQTTKVEETKVESSVKEPSEDILKSEVEKATEVDLEKHVPVVTVVKKEEVPKVQEHVDMEKGEIEKSSEKEVEKVDAEKQTPKVDNEKEVSEKVIEKNDTEVKELVEKIDVAKVEVDKLVDAINKSKTEPEKATTDVGGEEHKKEVKIGEKSDVGKSEVPDFGKLEAEVTIKVEHAPPVDKEPTTKDAEEVLTHIEKQEDEVISATTTDIKPESFTKIKTATARDDLNDDVEAKIVAIEKELVAVITEDVKEIEKLEEKADTSEKSKKIKEVQKLDAEEKEETIAKDADKVEVDVKKIVDEKPTEVKEKVIEEKHAAKPDEKEIDLNKKELTEDVKETVEQLIETVKDIPAKQLEALEDKIISTEAKDLRSTPEIKSDGAKEELKDVDKRIESEKSDLIPEGDKVFDKSSEVTVPQSKSVEQDISTKVTEVKEEPTITIKEEVKEQEKVDQHKDKTHEQKPEDPSKTKIEDDKKTLTQEVVSITDVEKPDIEGKDDAKSAVDKEIGIEKAQTKGELHEALDETLKAAKSAVVEATDTIVDEKIESKELHTDHKTTEVKEKPEEHEKPKEFENLTKEKIYDEAVLIVESEKQPQGIGHTEFDKTDLISELKDAQRDFKEFEIPTSQSLETKEINEKLEKKESPLDEKLAIKEGEAKLPEKAIEDKKAVENVDQHDRKEEILELKRDDEKSDKEKSAVEQKEEDTGKSDKISESQSIVDVKIGQVDKADEETKREIPEIKTGDDKKAQKPTEEKQATIPDQIEEKKTETSVEPATITEKVTKESEAEKLAEKGKETLEHSSIVKDDKTDDLTKDEKQDIGKEEKLLKDVEVIKDKSSEKPLTAEVGETIKETVLDAKDFKKLDASSKPDEEIKDQEKEEVHEVEKHLEKPGVVKVQETATKIEDDLKPTIKVTALPTETRIEETVLSSKTEVSESLPKIDSSIKNQEDEPNFKVSKSDVTKLPEDATSMGVEDVEKQIEPEKISISVEQSDKLPSMEDSIKEEKTVQQGEKDYVGETGEKTAIKTFHDDSVEISKIDKKLQELKDTVDAEDNMELIEADLEHSIKPRSQSKNEIDVVDKLELGRKSPKEREQDVAIIVASVAEVLKSDAPLEEFEGKIPLEITTFGDTYELRETHITTVESPIREDITADKMQMRPIEEEKSVPKDPISMFLHEERKVAHVHTDYDNLQKEESRVSSLLKDSNELIQATSKIISDIKQSSKVDDDVVSEDIKEASPPTDKQKVVEETSDLAVESKEMLLEKTSSILDESSPKAIDIKEQPLDSKRGSVDIKECDIKIDSSLATRKSVTDIKEQVQDALDADKFQTSSGKSSPEIKEPFRDVVDINKSLTSSGRVSPDYKELIKDNLKTDKSPSGKTTPDLRDVADVKASDKPAVEKTSADVKADEVHVSGKSSPEVLETIKKADTKESVVHISGKSTPEILEPIKKADTKTDEVHVSGKSAPEVLESIKKADTKAEEVHLSGKSTPEVPESIKKADTKADEVHVSGKSTPEVLEPIKKPDTKADEAHISGKSTPEVLEPVNKPDTKADELHVSGKSTPELLEQKKPEPDLSKPTSLSGKSSPDIKEAISSGKTTPDIKQEVDVDKDDFCERVASDKVNEIEKSSISSRKSTPDVKAPAIDLSKSIIDSEKEIIDVKSAVKSPLEIKPEESGKITSDITKPIADLSGSVIDSDKITSDIKETAKSSLDATPITSGTTTSDIKESAKDLVRPIIDSKEIITDIKSSLDATPIHSEKVTSEIKESATDLTKSLINTEKVATDIKEGTKNSIEATPISSGKVTPEIKEDLVELPKTFCSEKLTSDIQDTRKSSLDTSPVASGKTTPEIKEPIKDIVSDKVSSDEKEPSKELVKDALVTGRSSIPSGRSTPEIIEPIKDTLDAIYKSPILSGKTTPDIVIDEDNSSVGSGRSSPDVEIDMVKHVNNTDKNDIVIPQKPSETKQSTPEIVEDKKIVESEKHTEIKVTDSGPLHSEISSIVTKHSAVDTGVDDLTTAKDTSKSSVTSGKSTPDLQHSTKNGIDEIKSPVDSRKSSLMDPTDIDKTSSASGKSTPELKDPISVISGKTTPDTKLLTEKDSTKPGTSTPDLKSTTVVSDSKVTEVKEHPAITEHLTKMESIAGPSSSSKDAQISPSKSPGEELDYSRKSTPDIADITKSKDLEETSSGKTTPPTVPVSPIVKEKHPLIHDQEKSDKRDIPEVCILKPTDARSSTPASDDCDISSGQVSRVLTTEEDDDKQVYSDDEDMPGSPLSATSQVAHSTSSQYDFEESVRGVGPIDPMSTSFYGALPDDPVDLSKGAKTGRFLDEADLDFDKALHEHRQTRGEDLTSGSSPSHVYEITTAKYSSIKVQEEMETQKPSSSVPIKKESIMTSSFIGSELPTDPKDDPIASWGKPLGLPSPAPLNDNKGTPKKERRIPSNVMTKNKLNEDKKLSDSKYDRRGKKINPVYVDLTYVPHHGNSNYSYVDFFKRVRARYYVFSGIEPSKDVYNALLEAKQTWDDKELEVTIIPTYDTDVLGYWVAENEDLLAKYKIDLSPSASRCTINLQDHETSCSAYRLEFS